MLSDQIPLIELHQVSKTFGKPLEEHSVQHLLQRLHLSRPKSVTHAVDRVDLRIARGEVVGLVGESGCGKSTLGRMVAGLLPVSSGTAAVDGKSLGSMTADERQAVRLKVQMIFQDPSSSLNPRLRVDRIVGEGALLHGLTDNQGFDDYVSAQLQRAGLSPQLRQRYPHQFSGGQRQRIGIARALAVQPQLLVCDESVAALDVSIQAQILNLFMDLRDELGLTYLFISHDLGVVEHLCDRVVVMYLGRVVESASVDDLFGRANHPYTQALLAQIPRFDVRSTRYDAIKGEIPSRLNPPAGCHFHPRCPHASARCREEGPALREVSPNHLSACHLNDHF
ncbi:peptide ABC transporter ATP-binding protein [Pseudomonas sp. RIT-PI-q]|uniref:ABC transporter ATP-binding protein n=1 Tax=Pseudomonas sp. RIT-PI-q TaxID=1690247 RepID=UPI0006CC7D02|nr:ABC transporter ATP-binding protein [Pseudomonas sp. RIT-PI-q]KPG95466.1 peptide ABC transporter ATP-binding protein [Pseudomonas sp. RIT-PI-q]